MRPQDGLFLLKETVKEWNEDKGPRLGAALAYYTAFSLAPMLIIAVGIAGLIFKQERIQTELVNQIHGLVGMDREAVADFIGPMIENARRFRGPATLATSVGVITLLVGALGVFSQLQDALDTIWEVTPRPGRKLIDVLQNRFVSFAMVLGVGFLLLVSLVLGALLTAVSQLVTALIPNISVLLGLVHFVIPFVVTTGLFGLIFKLLPDVQIAWRDVWLGAALTALLFTIGKFLIGLYLGRSELGSFYGAAGSLIIMLVWVYYTAQIVFFGAEFTQVYVKYFGTHRATPSENALPLTEEQRAEQGIPHAETVRRLAETAGGASAAAPPAEPPAASVPAGVVPLARPGRSYAGALLGFAAGLGAGVMLAVQALRSRAGRGVP